MKFFAAIVAAVAVLIFPKSVQSVVYSPLVTQKHGPLYDGVKLLLIDEQFNANLMWNETRHHVNETTHLLTQAIDRVESYYVLLNKRLEELVKLQQRPKFKNCFKQYELLVASFNRELIDKYQVCKFSLNATLEHIQSETLDDLAFIENAGNEIAEIGELCGITKLKHSTSNQAGIVMCILARIGQIDQHLYSAAQMCLDIVALLSLSTEDEDNALNAESCSGFYDLKMHFDNVYENIQTCIRG